MIHKAKYWRLRFENNYGGPNIRLQHIGFKQGARDNEGPYLTPFVIEASAGDASSLIDTDGNWSTPYVEGDTWVYYGFDEAIAIPHIVINFNEAQNTPREIYVEISNDAQVWYKIYKFETTEPVTYDAAESFNMTAGSNQAPSVWRYGYAGSPGGAFTAYGYFEDLTPSAIEWHIAPNPLHIPSIIKNIGVGSINGIPPGSVGGHPGTGGDEYTTLQFHAPADGTYSITAVMGAGDTGETSFYVYVDGVQVMAVASTSTQQTYTGIHTLSTGDIVEMRVGSAGSFNFDSVPLALTALLGAAAEITLSPDKFLMNTPRVLVDNILERADVVFSGTGWVNGGTGAISRLINPFANSMWYASANTAVINMTFDFPISVNSIGVARHDLNGQGLILAYSFDNVTWHSAGDYTPARGNVMFKELAAQHMATARYWRLTLTGSTPAVISHLKIGVASFFERRIYEGVVPCKLDRDFKAANPTGSGGQHFTDRVIRERVNQALSVDTLVSQWVRVVGKPLIDALRDGSAFVAWRPDKYPLDVLYAWTTGDVKTAHTGPASYADFDVDFEGYDSWN